MKGGLEVELGEVKANHGVDWTWEQNGDGSRLPRNSIPHSELRNLTQASLVLPTWGQGDLWLLPWPGPMGYSGSHFSAAIALGARIRPLVILLPKAGTSPGLICRPTVLTVFL